MYVSAFIRLFHNRFECRMKRATDLRASLAVIYSQRINEHELNNQLAAQKKA